MAAGRKYFCTMMEADSGNREAAAEVTHAIEKAGGCLVGSYKVAAVAKKLKERGLVSPYLRSFVVARINPLRRTIRADDQEENKGKRTSQKHPNSFPSRGKGRIAVFDRPEILAMYNKHPSNRLPRRETLTLIALAGPVR